MMYPTDNPERIFPIASYDYVTGVTKDGQQVIMGLLCPELIAFFFSKEGNLVRREVRLWNYPAPQHPQSGVYSIYDKKFREMLEFQFTQWQNEIGFQTAIIEVKAFFDDDYPVGIEEVPGHLRADQEPYSPYLQWLYSIGEISEEIVRTGIPSQETPEDKEEREQDLKEWIESGSFVFWWARDYYMSKYGEVEST